MGLVDLDIHIPERFMSAAEISSVSGIPEQVLKEKFGILGKHVSESDEHVSDMCISAGRKLFERQDASEIDAVVYFGSHWKDYLVWQAAPKIQHALGIEGFSLELINVSAGAPVALRVVGDMMRADERLKKVLLVGASKESQLLDYSNADSRFMFNFGDGAVAVLLERDHQENLLLGTSTLTDGSFSDHVRVTAGGSAHPASQETLTQRMHYLQLSEGPEMKRRLDPITIKNFIKVAREALELSGEEKANFLLPIHVKRSLHEALLVELGLSGDQAIYLENFGHMSAVDPLFSLKLAIDEGRIQSGDVILLLAAGTGYTWAASCLRWG
ncbi:MAG: 3-oxoacyl-ACP synthase [Actinobacteria bacterium]|nr:3-oxoacyl-ACP synthase [Actinomycetota bacterium]